MRNRFFIIFLFSILLLGVLTACGKSEPRENTPESACEHRFSYEIVTAPTENAVGKAKGTCSLCKEEMEFFIPQLGEDGYEIKTTAATCTEDGEKAFTGEYGVFTVVLPKTGHVYKMKEEIPATCKQTGKKIFVCEHCGEEIEQTTDTVDHEYEVVETFEGNCEEKSYTVYRCIHGGETVKVEGEYRHEYGEGTHTDVPCEKGYTTYVCGTCGAERVVYDDAETHDYDAATGLCATCGKGCAHEFDGYVCKTCGLNVPEYLKTNDILFTEAERRVGEKVYFGFYPKSVVGKEETDLLAALGGATAVDGYYTVGGERYVQKKIANKNSAVVKFSDGSIFASYKGEAFFKVEPISWRVTKVNDDGSVLLISEYALFASDYRKESDFEWNSTEKSYFVKGTDVFADAFDGSEIEKNLKAFYAEAFTESMVSRVKETEYGKACLPVYNQLFDEEEEGEEKDERIRKATDFALGTGADASDRAIGRGTYYRLYEKGTGDGYGSVVTPQGGYGEYELFGTEERNAGVVVAITVLQ